MSQIYRAMDWVLKDRYPNWAWPSDTHLKFQLGDTVTKISGSMWSGRIVGWYATELTPEGYAVESAWHGGSVQIYPASALRKAT